MKIGRRRAGGTTKQSNNWRHSWKLDRIKMVCRRAGGRTKQRIASCKIKFWCQPTWSRTRRGAYDLRTVANSMGSCRSFTLALMAKPPFFSNYIPTAFMFFWKLTAWLDQLMDTNLEVVKCWNVVKVQVSFWNMFWQLGLSRVNLWSSTDHQMWQAVLRGHRPKLQLQSIQVAASCRSPPKARRPTSCYQHILCV